MYIIVDHKNIRTLNQIVLDLVNENQIKLIYYDADRVKPSLKREIKLRKEENMFSAVLGNHEESSTLYIISKYLNKSNGTLRSYLGGMK